MKEIISKLKKYFLIFGDRTNLAIYYYAIIPGIMTAMGAVLMYQIGLSTVPQRGEGETEEEYVRRQNS